MVHPEIIDPDEFEENENEDQREDKPGDPNALELPHVAQPNDNIYMNEVNVPYNKSPSRQNAGTHSPAVTNGLTSFHDLVDETWEALEHVEQLYEITESKFAETYPGKCAFIGQQKERPMFVFGNKEELVQRQNSSHIIEKDYFAGVFGEINESKGENFYSWLEEFLDLIVVASIVKIAEQMKWQLKAFVKKEVDTESLVGMYYDTFCMFMMYFSCFTTHTMFWVRFTDIPGSWDDYLHMLYGFGLTMLALFIPEKSKLFEDCSMIVLSC